MKKMKKLLFPILLVFFGANLTFSQNTAIPTCSVNSATDVNNWSIWPTSVSKTWFNGNCIAMFVNNLYQNQPVYITSPVFNVGTTGNYELELRFGLVYTTTPIVFELVNNPAGTVVSTSTAATTADTCTSWPNPKISKLIYIGLASGDYRLRVTIPANSQFFIEGLKSNYNYLSIGDIVIDSNFNIYPNPNHGSFFIKTNNSEPIETVAVFTLEGKLLFTKKITSTNEEIKTTGLSSGVYLLNIESKNGTSSNQKIIIQ